MSEDDKARAEKEAREALEELLGPIYVFVTREALAEWLVSNWKPLHPVLK